MYLIIKKLWLSMSQAHFGGKREQKCDHLMKNYPQMMFSVSNYVSTL